GKINLKEHGEKDKLKCIYFNDRRGFQHGVRRIDRDSFIIYPSKLMIVSKSEGLETIFYWFSMRVLFLYFDFKPKLINTDEEYFSIIEKLQPGDIFGTTSGALFR